MGDVDLSKLKVLIVDDFPTMRRIVRNLLKQIGITNVIEADNGQNALSVLETHNDIDLIISDWNMPVMTGIDFLKAVRSNPKTKHIPFIMVTAEAKKENILEAVKAGVSNYVVKPFTAETLKEKIQKVIKK